jgi:Protein of unknown function (DUF4235)
VKLLYKPFAIVAKSVAARLGKASFEALWAKLGDSEKPPSPTQGRVPLAKVATSAALEAATMAAVGATVDQVTARWFHYLFGAWPDKPKAKKDKGKTPDTEPTPEVA